MTLHALWGREEDIQPTPLRLDAALKMLLDRFKVDSVVVTLKDTEGSLVKMIFGADPLSMDCRNALKACAEGGSGIFVLENIALRDADDMPSRQSIRFYAGAPIVAATDGTLAGMLSLMAVKPVTLSEIDRAVLQSAALMVSAMLVMPHSTNSAVKIVLSTGESVVLVDHDQAIEAVNSRFTQLTGFDFNAVQTIGLEQLLCLEKPTAGAMVIGHALMAEISGQGMTRCMTRNGSSLPIEVLVFPLPGKNGKVNKTALLLAPLSSGKTDDFLLSLQPAERDELLALHIAGLWALDSTGRLTKLTGAPVAHILQSDQPYLLGQRLGDEGVFNNNTTHWPDFYALLGQGKLPQELECSVTFEGQTQWFSMRGYSQADEHGKTIGYHGSFRDITERKERELALQKSEERLSLILKGTNDGAWDWDLETGQYYLSPRWWDMMGRTPDAYPWRNEVWMEFIHPDDCALVRSALTDAIASQKDNYQTEFRLQHQRGHYITVLGRGHVLYNCAGKAVRTSGTNVDLTEQRKAQSQIRLLESCVKSIEDLVFITDALPGRSPGPTIQYVNPAFELITGYTSAEVVGKSPRLLHGPMTSRTALAEIADALHGQKSAKVELENYKKNGESFWVELEIAPVKADGCDQFTHWICIQRVITERKAVELALRTTTRQLDMAMHGASLGFWTRYIARNETFRDERWHAMLGYPNRSSTTHVDDWLQLVHPEDLAAIKSTETEAILQLDATFEREFRMRHSDGHWVWIQSRGKVVDRDATGKATVVAGTHMDITAAREARQTAVRLNAQLLRCLEHLNVGVVVQRNGLIKFVNSTLLAIFGAADQSIIVGTKFSDYILPTDLEDAAWRQSQLYAGASLPSFWFNCVHLDGHVFRAFTSSAVIEWEGEPHILSTMTPPGELALMTVEAETLRNRYDTMLAKRVETEQTRIAHELHDSVGSHLAGIGLHAANIVLLADESGGSLKQEADKLLVQIKAAAAMTRGLARGLAPVDNWPGAFWRALEKLCHDFSNTNQVTCLFDMQGNFDDVPAETGTHLYRITQEAISNAVRHGGATNIKVSLRANQVQMILCIQDNGVGFEAAGIFEAQRQGVGFGSMYARAKAIDAQISLEKLEPNGFCVAVRWSDTEKTDVSPEAGKSAKF